MQALRMRLFRLIAITGVFAFILGLTSSLSGVAAQGGMGDCVDALGIGAAGDACINVVHASPDAPDVDVYLNGAVALEGLEFGSFSGWVAVPAGEYQVQVTPAGAAIGDAVIDATVTLEAGAAYHVAATGLVANIAPAIFQADLSALDSGTARVRVLHTGPDAPAIDVAVTGGDVLVENLSFPNASGFLEVPAGSYDLEVRPTGTTDVALALPGVALESGTLYDVFAVGLLADGSLTVLVVPSATSSLVSGMPDTGAGPLAGTDGQAMLMVTALGALVLGAAAIAVRTREIRVQAEAVRVKA